MSGLPTMNPSGAGPQMLTLRRYLKEADEHTLGAWQPSPDFSHLAFSSNNYAWETGGVTAAPGSAYDYNRYPRDEVFRFSPGGGHPQQPGQTNPEEWIQFPRCNGEGRPDHRSTRAFPLMVPTF